MKKNITIIALLISLSLTNAYPCTTAVISGKASSDGRSYIWKLRDTGSLENIYRYFDDGKYNYIGLMNSNDQEGEHVWGGSNSVGFAIMNSASYNVNEGDTTSLIDMEGVFMKLALQTCATLQDLEKLLDEYPKPRGIAANFGVIDAKGGAAYYEVDNQTWVKFDANEDPKGYIIRSNYSESGTEDEGYGFVRRDAAEEIFSDAVNENKLNYETIIQEFTRNFYHPVFGLDYRKLYETSNAESDFIASTDLITRYSSASSIIVQGIKKGESADMNTIWAQVGFPRTCIAVPLWVRAGDNLPQIVSYDEEITNSRLNKYAMEWKKAAYPIEHKERNNYLFVPALINPEHTGYIQLIEPVEKEIFALTEEKLTIWRNEKPNQAEVAALYEKINNKVEELYLSN